MNASFSRLGGGALVVGAAAGIVVQLILAVNPSDRPTLNPTVIAMGWSDMVVGLVLILALPVLMSRVAQGSRLLSVIGFGCLVMAFVAFEEILGFERAVDTPWLVSHHVDLSQGPPLGMIVVLLVGGFAKIFGGIAFGIAAWRSRAVSRVVAGLIIAGSVVFASGLIPFVGENADLVGGVLLYFGLGAGGLQILGIWRSTTATGEPMQQTESKMGAAV
jgi:hypothetical protein